MIGSERKRKDQTPKDSSEDGATSGDSSSTRSTNSEPETIEEEEGEGEDRNPDQSQHDSKAEIEDWVEWIKRTTGLAQKELAKLRVEEWPAQRKRAYWRWAGHITRMTDRRWTVRILSWKPVGSRRVGRPKKRWRDVLDRFISEQVADDTAKRKLQKLVRHCGQECRSPSQLRKVKRWKKLWTEYEDEFVRAI